MVTEREGEKVKIGRREGKFNLNEGNLGATSKSSSSSSSSSSSLNLNSVLD